MTCLHGHKTIDGIRWFGHEPKQIRRVCLDCGARWDSPWSRVSDNERAEAYLTDEALRPRSPEMTCR